MSYTLPAIMSLFIISTRRLKLISQVIFTRESYHILGVDGSEGITAMTLSPSKKNLAVCERAERAICLIWDISGMSQNPPIPPKRKKVLTSSDYTGKEFISVAFAPSAEKTLLATLVCFKLNVILIYRLEKAVIKSFCGTGTNKNASHSKVFANLRTCDRYNAHSTTRIKTSWLYLVTTPTSSLEFRKTILLSKLMDKSPRKRLTFQTSIHVMLGCQTVVSLFVLIKVR